MSSPTLVNEKSFTAQVYILDGDIKRPIRIDDAGWLSVLNGSILPTTLWFACYEENGQQTYLIKEHTNGASSNGPALSLSANDYLGLYKHATRRWMVLKADGSTLQKQDPADVQVTIRTIGGRNWKVNDNFLKVREGTGSRIQLHILKWGVSQF